MTVLLSVMTPLALAAVNLEEISVRTSLAGSLPGCQFPIFLTVILGMQSASHSCYKELISRGRLQHFPKQDHRGFCGLTLNLIGN